MASSEAVRTVGVVRCAAVREHHGRPLVTPPVLRDLLPGVVRTVAAGEPPDAERTAERTVDMVEEGGKRRVGAVMTCTCGTAPCGSGFGRCDLELPCCAMERLDMFAMSNKGRSVEQPE